MIKLKPRPEEPNSLRLEKVRETIKSLEEKVNSGQKPTTKNPNDFPPHWLPEAREILWKHQNHKCCYCERVRELKRESDLEHFRPKGGVEKENAHFGYWWLAYEWENYLYSCKPCNQGNKKNQFPLLPGGQRATKKTDSLTNEKPVLINPYDEDEDPENYISFDWENSNDYFVKAVPTSTDDDNRGNDTINIVGLNKGLLPEDRAEFLQTLEAITIKMHAGRHFEKPLIIAAAEEEIKRETSSTKPFSGFRRAYFRKVGLGEYISDE